jgi:hypothetical protein
MTNEELVSKWEAGIGMAHLVKESGWSLSTVRRRLRKEGCDTSARGSLQGIDWDAARAEYLAGETSPNLADKYGVGHVTMYRHLEDLIRDKRPRYAKAGHTDKYGYVLVESEGTKRKEHIVLAEAALGRKLTSTERVHHIDMNRRNNKLDNLHVFPSQKEHNQAHLSLRNAAKEWCKHEGLWPEHPGQKAWGRMEYLGGILLRFGRVVFLDGRYVYDF